MTKRNVAFVSCDIIGHSAEPDDQRKTDRIRTINEIVKRTIGHHAPTEIVWASGGDGGHLAFFDTSLHQQAISLIRELFLWAQSDGVELRLTAHCGPASIIEGADGRNQLVGDGINLCGSLINFGTPGAVVVSAAFRDYIDRAPEDERRGVRFYDGRMIYLKHFAAKQVYFMSIDGVFSSVRNVPSKPDRQLLREALSKDRWHTIYHAKRLLQIDDSDPDAQEALESIKPQQLIVQGRSPENIELNPLLGPMSKKALQAVIRAAHLVERDGGTTICEQGDSGDSMFVILTGEIGVITNRTNEQDERNESGLLDIRLGPGEIVGELALALRRNRTATLQAVSPTALLAINYDTLRMLMETKPVNSQLKQSFDNLLMSRVLEHICHQTDYLGGDGKGPLRADPEPWASLIDDSERIVLAWDREDVISTRSNAFSKPGLYILAGGRLVERSRSRSALKIVDGEKLPILFVDLPNAMVNMNHEYRIDTSGPSEVITIVRVGDEVLRSFGPPVYADITAAIKRTLAKQFVFDAFISYNRNDEEIARQWRDAMEGAGLNVYMSTTEAMERFKNEIATAIADSLVMMPIVSPDAIGTDDDESWVQREIRYRKALFDEDHSNILPIELREGLAGEVADGFSPIRATDRADAAIAIAVETIQEVRSGVRPLPYSTKRLVLQDL